MMLNIIKLGIGDWGLGIGDWGLGIGPNPQSPIPIIINKMMKNNFIQKKFLYFIKLKISIKKNKCQNIILI